MKRMMPPALLLLLACGSAGPQGSFSPLIGGEGVKPYDIFVANVPSIRGTELPPAGLPARPHFDDEKATRRMHFLATYGEEVTPEEIGGLMLAGLEGVDFLTLTGDPVVGEHDDWSRTVEYETPDGRGRLTITARATDRPNRLEVVVEVEEELTR